MKGVSVMRNLFNKKQAENLTGVSSERVKLLVSEKFGDTEQVYTKPKYKKATVAIILAAALCITTAIAANSSWLIHYIFNDKVPDNISSEVEDINKSISDGEYIVTLEQALFGETTSYFIVSIEALTDEAFEKIESNSGGFGGFIFDLGLTFKYDGQMSQGFTSRDLSELDNGRKKYIAIEYTAENPKNSDLLVYPNIIDKPDLYMRIPVKSSIKTLDFQINQKVSNVVFDSSLCDAGQNSIEDVKTDLTIRKFSISPFDFTLEYKEKNKISSIGPVGLIAFIMNDGSIHGQGEFLEHSMSNRIDSYEQCIFEFKNIMEFDNIKAVIIDKTVYPLDKSKPYILDEDILFEPFICDDIYVTDRGFMPSIEEVCEKIGANFSFDEKAQTVTITYNGKTTTLNIGKTNIKFANRATETEVITEIVDENIICSDLHSILGIEIMCINFDENRENSDLYIAP